MNLGTKFISPVQLEGTCSYRSVEEYIKNTEGTLSNSQSERKEVYMYCPLTILISKFLIVGELNEVTF